MSKRWLWPLLFSIFAVSFFVDLACGSVAFSFDHWIFLARHPFEDNFWNQIFWDVRFPNAISVMISGWGLGVSGVLLQGFFRNPLADPGLVGVSVGAAFFVVLFLGIAILCGVAIGKILWILPLIAFCGAIFSMLLVCFMARLLGRSSSEILLLAGVGLSTFFAGISSVIFIGLTTQGLHLALWWSFGGETVLDWPMLGLSLLILSLSIFIALRQAEALDVNVLGELEALSLGVNIKTMRLHVLWAVALSAGTSVALTGPIAFVGLMVPHIMRYMFGFQHRELLWVSGVFGATLLLFSSALSRIVLAPAELPLGVVAAFVGLPFFFCFLWTKNSNKYNF